MSSNDSSNSFYVDAVLFDMDGTLISSTQGVIGAWNMFVQEKPHLNIDITKILSTAHGVRTVDNLRQYFDTPEDQLEAEAARFERAIVDYSDSNGAKGIQILPGVSKILKNLEAGRTGANPAWAICTSATRDYALRALDIAGITAPEQFIAAEDVKNGKPAPDPYLLGAKQCGVDPKNCLVLEDAPAGVRAGQAAGCKVIALSTSHTPDAMIKTSPDYLVTDLSQVNMTLVEKDGKRVVKIDVEGAADVNAPHRPQIIPGFSQVR